MTDQRQRLLIIEDDLELAELERDFLEANDFAVDIETDGSLGCQKAISDDYELVILDLMLPHKNGYEICRQIRKQKEIPILMISAKKEDIDKVRAFGLGVDDYMTKPFSPTELVARVKAHLMRYARLTRQHHVRNKLIQLGHLTIDQTKKMVKVNGQEVLFTAKEYELLLFLALHPNHIFSKKELFIKIWGSHHCGDLATVTVHIRKLREKIEQNPSKPQYIETVWGMGYRFKHE